MYRILLYCLLWGAGSAYVTGNTNDVEGIADTHDTLDATDMDIFTFLHYLFCIEGGYSV